MKCFQNGSHKALPKTYLIIYLKLTFPLSNVWIYPVLALLYRFLKQLK